MDWTAIAIFVAFIAYQFYRERKDERLWAERQKDSDRIAIERQNACHEFHRELNAETGKCFEAMANALEQYTKAVAEQADRHKIQNENYILILENEDLKAKLKILEEAKITGSVRT